MFRNCKGFFIDCNATLERIWPHCVNQVRGSLHYSLFSTPNVLPLPDQKTGLNLVLISFKYTFVTVA